MNGLPSDWGMAISFFAVIATALGFEANGQEFMFAVAWGVFAAFAASCILASDMVENAKPLPFFSTLLVGLLFAIMSGQVAQAYWPNIPLSLATGLGGFLSSFLGPVALKFASVISKNVPEIAARLIQRYLPKKSDGGDTST